MIRVDQEADGVRALKRCREELARIQEGEGTPMDILLGSTDWLLEERFILAEIESAIEKTS